MFKIRLLRPTETDLLNVKNFTHSRFQEKKNIRKKYIHFVEIDIMSNCSNF